MKSKQSASSHPPPSAKPLTAAITGAAMPAMTSPSRCASDARAPASAGVMAAIALTSAPATKALSPAPVRITQRTAGSPASAVNASSSACNVGPSSALSARGRLTVTVATGPPPPSTSASALGAPAALVGGRLISGSFGFFDASRARAGRGARRVLRILVEAAARLAPEPPRGDVLAQQRARPVLRIAELAVHDLEDRERRVEPDEVHERERPDR